MEPLTPKVDQNSPVGLDELLRDENFVFRLFAPVNQRQYRYFVYALGVVFWSCVLILLYELWALRVRYTFLAVLAGSKILLFRYYGKFMWSAFDDKEERIKEKRKKWRTHENQRRRRLMNDEEDDQLRRLLEQHKNLPTRRDSTSPVEGGKELVISVVKEGEYSNVTPKLTSVQVHNLPVGSQESSNSSEILGTAPNTAATLENQDSSGTREVGDSALRLDDPDCITVIQEEEGNLEESPAKLDEPEESETTESTERSSLMKTAVSQPDAEEEQSDAIEDTLPSDRSSASFRLPGKKMRGRTSKQNP